MKREIVDEVIGKAREYAEEYLGMTEGRVEGFVRHFSGGYRVSFRGMRLKEEEVFWICLTRKLELEELDII